MQAQELKFYIDYDRSYSHSFASGVEINSVNGNRFDLSFFYEKAHVQKEITTKIGEDGRPEILSSTGALKENLIEIDRILKASVSLDRETAKNLIEILQEQFK